MTPLIIVASLLAAFLLTGWVRNAMQECKQVTFPSLDASKVVIITGANSGLGFYTSLDIAKAGATVILACRSMGKCETAKQDIIKAVPGALVETMQLDLSSFDSIRTFAAAFTSTYDHVDVVVNNAGIMALPSRETTVDGLEAQIGTNHFGHFLLTALLLPHFAKNGRIVNHSSEAAKFPAAKFPMENLQSEGASYSPWTAYGNSKLANLLFTFELNRRLKQSGNEKNLISVAVHPGYTATNLQTGRFPLSEYANRFFAMNGEDGSLSQTLAAIGEGVEASMNTILGPRYSIFGAPAVAATAAVSKDEAAAKYLWEQSVLLTGADML